MDKLERRADRPLATIARCDRPGASFFLQNVLSAIRIVSVWNLQYTIYYALNRAWSLQVFPSGTSPYVFQTGPSYHNDMYTALARQLSIESEPAFVSPTPAFGFTWLNDLVSLRSAEADAFLKSLKFPHAPGLSNGEGSKYFYFSPSYPDALPVSPLLARYGTTNFIGTTTPIAYMQLTQAVVGAPVYFADVSKTGTNCSALYLVGFVEDLSIVAPPRRGKAGGGNQKVYLTGPGLSALLVKPPPSDWSLQSLLGWAKQNGVDLTVLAKLMAVAFYVAAVASVIRSRRVSDFCVQDIVENWEPGLEDLKKDPYKVANGLLWRYCL